MPTTAGDPNPELSMEAHRFWEAAYLAALQGGYDDPLARADKALDDLIERGAIRRAAHRLGVVRDLDNVISEIEAGKKINAIKELRAQIPGFGLKDAKEAVEQYMETGTWPTAITVHYSTKFHETIARLPST